MLGERACLRGGWSRTRAVEASNITTPVLDAKSSGGPHERHLVLHQLEACCKVLPYFAGAFPFHMINTAISARNQP